jgi:DNA-nicking Smr family endonuclease
VEDELDLHGYTRDLARRLVDAFLRRSTKNGVRCVRIIHGVGHGSAGGEPVLRGMVHSWLVQTAGVVAFCVANRSDGGNGALIVLLRPALEQD